MWNTEGEILRFRFDIFSLDPSRPFLKALSGRRAWIFYFARWSDKFLGRPTLLIWLPQQQST